MPFPFQTSLLRIAALAGLIALAPAAALPAAAAAEAAPDKAAIEAIVRDYILANPEIVEEALAALQAKKSESEAAERAALIASAGDILFNSKRQVVLGDPNAPITLVEFFDYNCGYCKRALDDMNALLDSEKDVRIVLKEFPILGPGSVEAARVAIAVNLVAPEKYRPFHDALLASETPADKTRALEAVQEAGIDVAAVEARLDDAEVVATIGEVYEIAEKLGLTGTPTYVIGKEVVFGAVGADELRTRIEAMRQCGEASC